MTLVASATVKIKLAGSNGGENKSSDEQVTTEPVPVAASNDGGQPLSVEAKDTSVDDDVTTDQSTHSSNQSTNSSGEQSAKSSSNESSGKKPATESSGPSSVSTASTFLNVSENQDQAGGSVFARSGTPWHTKSFLYPVIYCSPGGIISVILKADVVVEITVDRAVRVLCSGKFATASNHRANASCIMHPQARVYQEDAKVFSSFGDEKQAVIGAQGIIFTMKDLPHAYMVVTERVRGTLPFPRNSVNFPELPKDASLSLFYSSEHGTHLCEQCCAIVQAAHYHQDEDGSISVNINGISIKQSSNGDVDVNARPRRIQLSPTTGNISLRTHYVHMGVQDGNKAFIKRGVKRVHVSSSGMVISDGNQTTSLDYLGRIFTSAFP